MISRLLTDSLVLDRQPGPRWEITDALVDGLRVSSGHSGVMTVRSFSACKRCVNGASVRLELAGDVRGLVAEQLIPMILDAIVTDLADEVYVDLDEVTFLDSNGVLALVCGYVAAVEFGTIYRVGNAREQVHRTLQACGVLDVLADNQDLGAATLPGRHRHRLMPDALLRSRS